MVHNFFFCHSALPSATSINFKNYISNFKMILTTETETMILLSDLDNWYCIETIFLQLDDWYWQPRQISSNWSIDIDDLILTTKIVFLQMNDWYWWLRQFSYKWQIDIDKWDNFLPTGQLTLTTETIFLQVDNWYWWVRQFSSNWMIDIDNRDSFLPTWTIDIDNRDNFLTTWGLILTTETIFLQLEDWYWWLKQLS